MKSLHDRWQPWLVNCHYHVLVEKSYSTLVLAIVEKFLTYLSHCSQMISHTRQRLLFPNNKIYIHEFMTKCRKFIAKAQFINSSLLSYPCVAVRLLLDSTQEHLATRSFQNSINVIMTSRYNLQPIFLQLGKHNINYKKL